MDKKEEILELKKLQGYLQKRSDAEDRIRQCEYDMSTLERRLDKKTDIRLKPTDQCETERKSYKANVRLEIVLALVIGFIAICALVYGICVLFVKDDWYAPNILKVYEGYEYNQYSDPTEISLEITSCDTKGNLEGIYKYKYGDSFEEIEIEGNITQRDSQGCLFVTVTYYEKLYGTIEMDFFIYNDCNAIRGTNRDMSLYTEGYNKSSFDQSLSTSALINKYSNGELETAPAKSRAEQYATSALEVVILVYPFLAFAAYKILSNVEILTKKQKKRLAELRKLDAANKKENEKNLALANTRADEERRRVTARCARDSATAKIQLAECDRLIAECNIVFVDDKNLNSVEFLIKQLESGRADTLKEALEKLDAHNENRKARFEQKMHQMQMNNMVRDAMARAESDQICHNFNVMQEQRRQTKELEEINKKLDEYSK